MIRRILKITSFCAAFMAVAFSFSSCSEEEEYYDRFVEIKEKFFRQNLKANTYGGNRATVINSREELENCLGDAASKDPMLLGINFDNSTFILDSDTLIYVLPTNIPDVVTSSLARGLTGNYSFSYSIETQKADTGDKEKDEIANAKRDFTIGIIVSKLPDDAVVYLDKNIHFLDSTVHGYPTKIEKIKRVY